jgi:Coenzyme PQQ synthesis protein D (PqqD)
MPKIDGLSLVCSTGNLPFTRLHEDLLAIDQLAGYCYSMNPPAARIWELIPSLTPVSSVCAILCREFSVDETQCREDVISFLTTLADAGLVKVAG